MILYIITLSCLLLAGGYVGYRHIFRIDSLNQQRVINGALTAALLLTVMSVAHWTGLFPQWVAAKVTSAAYTVAAGFFTGYGIQLIGLREEAGEVEYMHRSFWTDVAPSIVAAALFIFGIYRTGLLDWNYFTDIGITSGLSLMGFGFWGWTVRVVPEFRRKGILVLDKMIPWKKLVSYSWVTEDIVQIDYINSTKKISDFQTFIPSEDQLIIERILGRKIEEYEKERNKLMLQQKQSE